MKEWWEDPPRHASAADWVGRGALAVSVAGFTGGMVSTLIGAFWPTAPLILLAPVVVFSLAAGIVAWFKLAWTTDE